MRCHEAKRKIGNMSENDAELSAHLAGCPSCSREALAETVMSDIFKNARAQAADSNSSLEIIRSKLAAKSHRKESSIMANFKQSLVAHPKLSVSAMLVSFIALFLVLVPLPYQRTIGYNVAISGIDARPGLSSDYIVKALQSLGYENLSVSASNSNSKTDYLISNISSAKTAREIAAALQSLTSSKSIPTITPVLEASSATLFAQIRDKTVTIEVEGQGKSDAEIKAEVEAKLRQQGYSPSVTVETDSSGRRNISINIEK